MNKSLTIVLIVLINNLIFAQSQYPQIQTINIPYYIPFESDNWNSDGFWQLQCEQPDRIQSVFFNQNFSNVLKMTVQDGDMPNDERDRSEIALFSSRHTMNNDETYYYSYDYYISDESFTINDNVGADFYQFIAQWHDDDNSNTAYNICSNKSRVPPIMMKLILDPDNLGNTRDIRLKMGTGYGSCINLGGDLCNEDNLCVGQKIYTIKNAVKKGEWNHFVFRIKWSIYPTQTEMQVWINDKPINNLRNDPNNINGCQMFLLDIGQPNEIASILSNVALLYYHYDNYGNILTERNYFKVGQYRKNINSTNTNYVDNFRITKEYPPSPKETYIISEQCNTIEGCSKNQGDTIELSPDNYTLNAYKIEPSDIYIFEFVLGSERFYAGSRYNMLNLLTLDRIRAGKVYSVSVRVRNNTYFPYGKSKSIITPSSTYLRKEYCGENLDTPYVLSSQYGRISCYPILGATKYRYRFINILNPNDILYFDSNIGDTSINVYDMWGLKYNTTYNVQIRAIKIENGIDSYQNLPYGRSCYIRTPLRFIPPDHPTMYFREYHSPKKNYKNNDFKLFPNPTYNNIEIMANDNLENITILDAFGRKVKTLEHIFKKSTKISLEDLPIGVYTILLKNINGQSRKIIIKK